MPELTSSDTMALAIGGLMILFALIGVIDWILNIFRKQ